MSTALDRPKRQIDNIKLEGARITFKNFEGREGQYNQEGDRNFALLLDDPKMVEDLEADGWNVKYLRAREEGEQPQPYIQVSVSYKNRPPRVVLVTSKGKTTLPEDLVMMVDWVDIAHVDVIINPYQWAVSGKTGVKAYLKAIYVVVMEDELEQKYSDVPEIDFNGAPLQITDGNGEDDDIVDGEVIEDDQEEL